MLSNPLPNPHLHALLLLSQPREKLAEYIPEFDPKYKYEVPTSDGPIEFEFPGELALYVCFMSFRYYEDPSVTRVQKELIQELLCIIELLYASSVKYPYVVFKNDNSGGGPFDRTWEIMRRLALEFLKTYTLEVNEPTVDFEKFISQLEYTRVINTSDEQDP